MKKEHAVNLNPIEIFEIAYKNKFKLASYSFLAGLLVLLISLLFPNIYKSEALVAPVDPENTLTSNLLELNSLQGLNFGLTNEAPTKIVEGVERLKSFAFFELMLSKVVKLEDLFAAKSWDYENNVVIYDENIYKKSENLWTRDVDFPYKLIPSSQEAFEEFEDLFSVQVDDDTGFITISVEHISPYIAAEWASAAVALINQIMADNDKKRALSSIKFLEEQIIETNLAEIKDAIASLIEQQTQILMLVESNEDYIFKVIDPPVIQELHEKPNRLFLTIIGAFLGAIMYLLFLIQRKRS